MDNAIRWINRYPLDSAISFSKIFIRWIVINPLDSAIQRLNNLGLIFTFHNTILKG